VTDILYVGEEGLKERGLRDRGERGERRAESQTGRHKREEN
jgi:hypothetical protein